MIIQKIFAEEIFNAQGFPTIQCSIVLENGTLIQSSIPSSFETPDNAIPYVYDADNRIVQQRMQQSIEYINKTIVPMFMKQSINALAMDSRLIDLHASSHDINIGSNTTLVVSITLFKAQAAAEGIEPFQLLQSISGSAQSVIPQPLTSLMHFRNHDNLQEIKELLAFPSDKNQSYEEQLHSMIMLHHHTKKILELKKHSSATSPYGSFVPAIKSIGELFEIIAEIKDTLPTKSYEFGLNISANELYDPTTETYTWQGQALTSHKLISLYQALLATHPDITYIHDGMATKDVQGWKLLSSKLSSKVHNAGDNVFGTSPMRIRWGILQKIANIVVIKPEYISTISQTLAAIDACKNNDKQFLIVGDTLGTHDTFISDLAVGTGATFLKAGAPYGSEHMAKYNRLLEIERILNHSSSKPTN